MKEINLCGDDKCTQCYSCVISCPPKCILMIKSEAGFCVPQIDYDKCIGCGLCQRVCHQKSRKNKKLPLKTYAAWSKDENIRMRSSSGGAFSAIATEVIKNGGVVFGASMQNLKVMHIMVETIDDLKYLRGSKYVQSYIGDTYKTVKHKLIDGSQVLFVGTPCQVSGLYNFLQHKYNNLITCDFVCHGVPSQESFDIYTKKIGVNAANTNEITFRYLQGWGFQMSRCLESSNRTREKRIDISVKKAYYIRAFTKGLMFSQACYSCDYATVERISDITLGDFWGIGNKKPFNHSMNRGISLVLANSEKGKQLIESSNIYTEERELLEAIEGNHNLSNVSELPNGRYTYYEDSKKLSIDELSRKYNIQPSLRDYLRPIKRGLLNILNSRN